METFAINYLEGDDRSVEFDSMLAMIRRTGRSPSPTDGALCTYIDAAQGVVRRRMM